MDDPIKLSELSARTPGQILMEIARANFAMRHQIRIAWSAKTTDGGFWDCEELLMRRVNVNDLYDRGAPVQLSMYDAPQVLQTLMDNLWGLGVRPTSNPDPDRSKAQNEHLADLRKILFHQLKIK